MLEAALNYLSAGYSIIPLTDERKPCIEWTEYQRRKPTEQEVRQWWEKNPKANIGIVCGQVSKLAVLDIDPRNGGTLEGVTPTGLIVRTPRGGWHFYYRTDQRVPKWVPKKGWDLQGEGSYVVAPPSRSIYGKYQAEQTGSLTPFPSSLMRPTTEQGVPPTDREKWLHKALSGDVGEGERNDTLARLAGYYVSKGMPEDVVLDTVTAVVANWRAPLTEEEIRTTVHSVGKKARREAFDLDRMAPPLSYVVEDVRRQVERRINKEEVPVPLPWPRLAQHLGGGLWPGVHILVAPPKAGKSQFAIQAATHAAMLNVPVVYVSLGDLRNLDIVCRIAGHQEGKPWTQYQHGIEPLPDIEVMGKPFRILQGKSNEFNYELFDEMVKQVKERHGTAPFIVLDYLQMVQSPEGSKYDMRERIGKASYRMQDAARDHGATFLVISGTSRENYSAGKGRTKKPGQFDPGSLMGGGKEAGEIEYSAESVMVLMSGPPEREVPKHDKEGKPIPGKTETVYDLDAAPDTYIALAAARSASPRWFKMEWDGGDFQEHGSTFTRKESRIH